MFLVDYSQQTCKSKFYLISVQKVTKTLKITKISWEAMCPKMPKHKIKSNSTGKCNQDLQYTKNRLLPLYLANTKF